MTPNIEIIVGTYEDFLLGYKLETKENKEVLTQSFADKSHSGAIKCLAVQGPWIASGSTDDRIFIYDMRLRKQSQILLSHDGTVNTLAFTFDETHLLSGGDDGQMFATRLDTWFTEGKWQKAHNGSAVTHISCHPSSKLAFTLGSDLVLRTWNLVKGRVAYKKNLKSRNTLGNAPDCLCLSPEGEFFTLCGQRVVEIWSTPKADVIFSQTTTSKPICVCWIAHDTCLVGLEDGNIQWITIKDAIVESSIKAHNSRVKAISFYKGVLATASSLGDIKLWTVNNAQRSLTHIASTNIGCRPTCIAILDLEQFGDNVVLTKTINRSNVEIKRPEQTPQQQKRGVVTIEYENNEDDDEDDDEDGYELFSDSDDEEFDEDSVPNDDEETSSDEISSTEETPQKFPNSNKRKLNVIKNKNQNTKAKLPKSNKKQAKVSTQQKTKKQSSSTISKLNTKKNRQKQKFQ